MFLSVTDTFLSVWTDYRQTQLFARRKHVPGVILFPRKKTGAINPPLIIETNGLTFSQAEHSAPKKPKVLIKT